MCHDRMRVEQCNALFTNIYVRLNPPPQSGCWSCWNLFGYASTRSTYRCGGSGAAGVLVQSTKPLAPHCAVQRTGCGKVQGRCRPQQRLGSSYSRSCKATLRQPRCHGALLIPLRTVPPFVTAFQFLSTARRYLGGPSVCSNFQPNSFSQTASFWRHRDTPTALLLFIASSCCR